MTDFPPSPDFEDQVRSACALPAPDPQFVSRLRSSLAARAAHLSQQPAQPPRLAFFRRPAWAVAIIILLALAGATFAVGPQRVWAAVQGLLGYIPGVGIVPVDSAVGLAEPYEFNHNGVTVRVESLVSTTEHTYLTYTIQGLPDGEQVYYAHLELPDGTKYYSRNRLSVGSWKPESDRTNPKDFGYQNSQEFYSLPKGTREVTLVWGRREREDKDPFETWVIPLQLQPISGGPGAGQYTAAYTLENVSTEHHDLTLKVTQVAPGKQKTVISLGLVYPDSLSPIGVNQVWFNDGPTQLMDDLGRVYRSQVEAPDMKDLGQPITPITDPHDPTQTYSAESFSLGFEPLQPGIQRLSLSISNLNFRAYQWPLKLHVDLGPDPKFGDEYPLDADLQVADQKIHIRGAQLVEKTSYDRHSRVPVLELLVDSLPDDSWIQLHFIAPQGSSKTDEAYTLDVDSGEYLSGMILAPDQLQAGSVDFVIEYVEGILSGPWEVSWDQP